MSKIPLVASADDLPAAITFAQLNTESRWFVTHRANALKHLEDIPNEWSEKLAITAAIKPAEVTAAEKAKIDADVADGHEEKLPSAIVDPDNDGDDDLTAKGDTDHDGAAYRKSLGLKADSMQAAPAPGEEDDEEPDEDEDPGALTSAIDYAALVAGGYYSDYGPEDDYDNYDIDTEMPVTASGQVIVATAFTADERQQYAKNKIALPDGSFPIPNKRFLAKAIRAIGRAKNNSKDTIRKHIVKRAKALGASYMLPDSYKGVTAASAEFAGSADQASNKAHDLAKALLRKSVAPITAAIVEERDQAKAALRERAGLPKAVDGEAVDSPEVPDGTSVAVVAANAVNDIEKAGHDFSEALHPRGKDGKFITKGGRVIADDGAGHRVEGTVEAIHAGLGGQAHIQIKTDQGHTVLTTADHVTNAPTAVAHLGGPPAPHAMPTTASEHLDNAQHHLVQANKHLDSASKTTTPHGFAEHEAQAKAHREQADVHRNAARALLEPDLTQSHTGETVSSVNEFAHPASPASELKPGDTFISHGTKVTVTEGLHPDGEDKFGRPMSAIKGRREDTGVEGKMQFGPGGVVHGREVGSKADTDAKLAEDVGGKVTPQLRSDTEKAAEGASSPKLIRNSEGRLINADGPTGRRITEDAATKARVDVQPKSETDKAFSKALSDYKSAKSEGDKAKAARAASDAASASGATGLAKVYQDKAETHDAKQALREKAAAGGRFQIRESSYRGQTGHTISGTDSLGRKPSVFTPDGRADAEQVKKNLQEGKSAFAHKQINSPTNNSRTTGETARQAEDRILGKEGSPEYKAAAQSAKVRDDRASSVLGDREDHVEAATFHARAAQLAPTQALREDHELKAAQHREAIPSPVSQDYNPGAQSTSDAMHSGNHQEAVVEQLKRMGYSDRTAKGARNLTSKDKSTRIKVNDDGSFGMKVNSGNGVFSARKHGVDTSGDAHSVASALHEAGKAAPAVKPHANNKAEANVLQARKEVLRNTVAGHLSSGPSKPTSTRYVSRELTTPENGHTHVVIDTHAANTEEFKGGRNGASQRARELNEREDKENGQKQTAITRAETMFGSDRSKWTKAQLGQAASLGDPKALAELEKRNSGKA